MRIGSAQKAADVVFLARIQGARHNIPADGFDVRDQRRQLVGITPAGEDREPFSREFLGNVNFPLLETTERVFRKVWELGCYAGFLTGREAARLMLPRGKGCIFFTGATASVRGGIGYAAFASAKHGLRAVAQSMARELGPKNIHVAHLIIDAGVDTAFVRERIKQRDGAEALDRLKPDELMHPASIAEAYWQLYRQPRDAWTFELDVRPYGEAW